MTTTPPRAEMAAILREAAGRLQPSTRRLFLRRAAGLGTLSLLTGCDATDAVSAERALDAISDFNDRVQAWLFDPHRLAREYPPSAITRPFPFNAFYRREEAPEVAAADWTLEISGRVADQRSWTLGWLNALPQSVQITRHICIEGWSAIGQWEGPRLSLLLERIGADRHARYVTLRCADNYVTSLDMATALHPQTILALRSDGVALPREHGFPVKLRVPTKLGFKNPKHLVSLEVGNEFTGGYWETYGYNWFSGL